MRVISHHTNATPLFNVYEIGAEDLCDRVLRASGNSGRGSLSVGVIRDCDEVLARLDFQEGHVRPRPVNSIPVPIGCLAKVFTATLMRLILTERGMSIENTLRDVLPNEPALRVPLFGPITIRDLVNHTHGLNFPLMLVPPYLKDGRIDLTQLARTVCHIGSFSSPGEIYSYGSVGSWLAAAVVEQVTGENYTSVLERRLLSPLGIKLSPASSSLGPICPALGGGYRATTTDLLRFLRLRFENAIPALAFGKTLGDIFPMPGWGSELGIANGWKWYGEGWYGHNAVGEGFNCSIRINDALRLGIVISSVGGSSASVMRRLFRGILPEFSIQFPKQQSGTIDFQQYFGTYTDVRRTVQIALDESGHMRMKANGLNRTLTGRDEIACDLKPCTMNMFLADSEGRLELPWIQFIRPTAVGFSHLWDGYRVLRRHA